MFQKALLFAAMTFSALTWSAGEMQAAKLGQTCGGFAGIRCNAGLWCDPKPESCHVADASGTCVRIPHFCTRIFRPVCGCNGRTYGNDCQRV